LHYVLTPQLSVLFVTVQVHQCHRCNHKNINCQSDCRGGNTDVCPGRRQTPSRRHHCVRRRRNSLVGHYVARLGRWQPGSSSSSTTDRHLPLAAACMVTLEKVLRGSPKKQVAGSASLWRQIPFTRWSVEMCRSSRSSGTKVCQKL